MHDIGYQELSAI